MKAFIRGVIPTLLLITTCMVDIPIFPLDLVPEAQAIFGVRRRTAVVAYSAGKSSGAAAASASQQQAAAAQQQAAMAEQEAAAAKQQAAIAQQQATGVQATSGAPLGTVIEVLPSGCVPVTVGKTQYQKCDSTFYRAAFMGNKLVYVAVENPLQ
ncbi:hypothetical protein [Desulfogranum marinum]|uniref:hypothetical protein n=1 Tax=Desulfogranum marinum TaxID=453220 RepID=UPI0029C93536|nr:hypothetical protein [Desulfogranum marinum]